MIAPLVQAVEQAGDPEALLKAVQALAASGDPEAIPHLIRAFGYNQTAVSEAALSGVVAFGPRAVEPLLTQIDGYDYGARAYSVRALAKIGDPRAVNFLLDAVVADFAPSVRRAALRGLGRVAAQTGTEVRAKLQEVFRRCAQDSDWGIRYALICALEELGAQEFEEVVDLLLRDPDPLVQVKARLALAG